ncbi:hypothetical protein HGB46_00480 [Nocardiopsis dassonvillei]|jgi:hypothetical protein|uniref:Uncharacterized protein n=3 Tax=Nocardiopsidaceae TaxID=83676 RepID=D7B8C0_NOCDD|nr:conserved hypothetical protein [Nocardiopsis dassonvillei subsp. dassonvillei DSM 43111]APC33704.1 hypothetical protein A9R04_02830 [Nocardiopsis dassonvillei]ASU56561.1 hypothetical protein CGQ36_02930 [Nocardiopsis dassonvillei]NKY77058.1 hypothetical protein [Nocardiopsis dassonvillei]VEI91337.1 Uncharacterised protein [Nocardiopsis dassonvillei]
MVNHHFQRGHLTPDEQQDILTQIGARILDQAPDGWAKIVYTRKSVIEQSTSTLVVEFEDGTSQRESVPSGMGLMIDDLRAGMYQEGKGTWFSFEYVITPPGRFNVTYNYDEDPGITFPTAFGYTNDLKYFPRDEEYMTDWLREKLQEEAEGRAME